VEEILKQHKPEPLGPEIREKLSEVVKEGERELTTKQRKAER
jgi:trimethylamine:corrinoid methyltransferase-like protein